MGQRTAVRAAALGLVSVAASSIHIARAAVWFAPNALSLGAHRPKLLKVGAERLLIHRRCQAAHKNLLGALRKGAVEQEVL